MADDELLSEPTIHDQLNVQIRGWHNEDENEARSFAGNVMSFVREWSRYLDLSLLDEVVIAYDYEQALANASGEERESSPTTNEFGTGAAMALTLPDGEGSVRSKVVISTYMVTQMFDEDDSLERRLAQQTLAHELVHVDDLAFLATTFPGGMMAAGHSAADDNALMMICDGARSEYSATMRTAVIEPSIGDGWIDMLGDVLRDAESEMLENRKKYQREQMTLDEFWLWGRERARFIFQALGYAVGHVDGVMRSENIPQDVKDQQGAKLAEIEEMSLGWLIGDTREAMQPIMEQESWTGLEVLDPLLDVGDRLLQEFGLFLSERDGELYIDIPFRGLIDL